MKNSDSRNSRMLIILLKNFIKANILPNSETVFFRPGFSFVFAIAAKVTHYILRLKISTKYKSSHKLKMGIID